MKISLWLFFLFGRDTVLRRTAAAKPVYNNPLSYKKDALKDFSQIYVATKDLSGSATKAIGAPSVILEAISKRLASYLPKTRQVGAGCRIPSNDIVGPAAFGGYDLLLAPDRALGQCITPSDKSPMLWRGAIPDRESYERSKNLPAAEDVFEAVFERKGPQARVGNDEVNLNFWFVSFVNWFHDDNFRTEQGSDGTYNWSDKVGLRMSQVYGHTSERQQALRAFSNGKMKTQTLGKWAYFPPSLQSIQAEYPGFDMWTPETGPVGSSAAADKTDADVDTALFFAIGDPRFNMHPGHLMWATIALYLHNQACDAILGSNPEFNDEEVFQRARAIVFHLVQTTRLNDFISDSVSHTRDHFSIPYDPPTLREDIGRFLNFKGGIPNYLEFNHIYHAWHSFIPDALEIDGETVSMRQLMWKPELFHATPLSKIAAGFTKTPVAKYGPHSFLPFLRDITVQALKDERSQRMPGYNSYRANFGLEPLTSFDQLGVDDPDAVAGLYANNIDNLELLPGVLADNQATIPGNLLGDIQLVMVTLLAVEDLVSDEILSNPVLWSEDYLTKGGFEFLQRYNFADVLGLILDGAMPTPACPFRSSDKGCAPEEEWVDFDKTLHCFMCMSSVCSYIGLDLTEWFFDDNGYMRSLAASLTIAAAIMCVMYTTLFAIIQRLIPQEEKDENRKYVSPMKLRLLVLAANSVVTLGLAIPTTWFWIELVGNPNWIDEFSSSTYLNAFWGVSLVSAAFIAEIAMRLSLVRGSLRAMGLIAVHHIGYYYLMTAVLVTTDVLVIKVAITILCGFVWEWTMYVAFFLLRLGDAWMDQLRTSGASVEAAATYHRRFIKYAFPTLIGIYLATRVLETVVVIQLLVCGAQRYFGPNTVDSTPFWVIAPIAPFPLLLQFQAGWSMITVWRDRLKKSVVEGDAKIEDNSGDDIGSITGTKIEGGIAGDGIGTTRDEGKGKEKRESVSLEKRGK